MTVLYAVMGIGLGLSLTLLQSGGSGDTTPGGASSALLLEGDEAGKGLALEGDMAPGVLLLEGDMAS